MKRLISLATLSLLLAACGSQDAASIIEQDTSLHMPSGFTGIQVMNACATASGDCFPLEVESDGDRILGIHYPTDIWAAVVDSGCSSGYCWAFDENGAEWKLEP